MPRVRTGLGVATENLHALPHPRRTSMAATGGPVESPCYVEPDAVIANGQLRSAICLVQLDPDVPRPCMPHHVGQSLLS